MWQDQPDEEEAGEEESSEEDLYGVKPAYIIAIDINEKMFVAQDKVGAGSYFKDVLNVLKRLYESVFFTYKSINPIAVLLACEEEDKVPLINYSMTVLEAVQIVEKLLHKSESDLKNDIMRTSDFSMANFLFTCQRKFIEAPKGTHIDHKLFYITREDDPFSGSGQDVEESKFRALNTLKLLEDGQVKFQVIPYKTDAFNEKIFYEDVAKEIPKTYSLESLSSDEDLFSLLWKGVIVADKRLTKFYWHKNNPEEFLYVNLVSVNKKEDLLRKRARRQNLELLQQKYADSDTELDPSFKLKSKNPNLEMTFTQDQVDSLYVDIPNGIHFLSVQPVQHRLGYTLKKHKLLFLRDKEDMVPNDMTCFNTMWDHCHDRQRVIMCLMRLQRNHKLEKVELEPICVEKMRCFVVRVLPSANNIRYFTPPTYTDQQMGYKLEINEKLVEKLFARLHVDFHPMQIENPRLESHRKYVMDKMLERDFEAPENMITKTVEEIKEKVSDLKEDFCVHFGLLDESAEPKAKRYKKGK